MDNNYWSSPRGQYNGNFGQSPSPRYRGGRQQWNNSPRFFPQNSPYASTPYHQPYRPRGRGGFGFGHRGRGRGGGHGYNQSDDQGIEAWISPAMWEDPWKEFTDLNATKFADLDSSSMNQTQESEISTNDVEPSTSASMLNVSDMIMPEEDASKNESSANASELMTLITS